MSSQSRDVCCVDQVLSTSSSSSLSNKTAKCNTTEDPSASKKCSHVLKLVFSAVCDDDTKQLEELSVLIDAENESFCSQYADVENPFKNTNIVIMACKLTKLKVLEYIFNNGERMLNIFSCKIGGTFICPSQEDENLHNAFYYAIRNGNVDVLKTLIYKWPNNNFVDKRDELSTLLSEAHLDLKLKNVEISHEMEILTASVLVNICLNSRGSVPLDNDNFTNSSYVAECLEIIFEKTAFLVSSYSHKKVDDEFLFILRFIAKCISNLQKVLKFEYVKLPWEEITFLLIIFFHVHRCQNDSFLSYCSILSKEKILRYLQYFSACLQEYYDANIREVDSNCIPKVKQENNLASAESACSTCAELLCDFKFVKNIHLLETLKNYLTVVILTDCEQENTPILLTRCLQVIKGSIENNFDFHKLSSVTCEYFLQHLSEDTRKIVFCKCDPKSFIHSLFNTNIKEEETRNKVFNDILKDINEMNVAVNEILNKIKIKNITLCLEQIVNGTNLEEAMLSIESLDTMILSKLSFPKEDMTIHEQVENFVRVVNKLIGDKTMFENQLLCEIKDKIHCDKPRLTSSKANFDLGLSLLKYLKYNIRGKKLSQMDFIDIKRLCSQILIHLNGMKSLSIKEIAELVVKIWTCIVPRKQSEVGGLYKIILKLLLIAEIEAGHSSWVNDLWYKLNKNYFLYLSGPKEGNIAHMQCPHAKLSYELNCNLKDIICNSAQTYFENLNTDFPRSDLCIELCDNFLCYKRNKTLQAIVEVLVLDELSDTNLTNICEPGNLLIMEEHCPMLVGKKLKDFLCYGNGFSSEHLFDPSIATFFNAAMLCCDSLNKNIKCVNILESDTLRSKENLCTKIITLGNQKNMFNSLIEGNLATLKTCIQNGADVKGRDFNLCTALHFAAQGSNVEVLKFLTEQNVSVNVKNMDGQNPLHIAAMNGRKDIVEYFIKETSVCVDQIDNIGKTPLIYAIQNGFKDVVDILLNSNMALNNFNSLSAGKTYCEYVAQIFSNETKSHCEVTNNMNLLHAATRSGCVELIDTLLQNKVNIHAKDVMSESPLHIAARNGYLQMVKKLISKGTSVNDQNIDGCTPLHLAIQNGHGQVVTLLLEQGSNVNLSEKNCRHSPLHYAAQGGHKEIIKLLLENGANVNATSLDGKSSLHFAVMKGYEDIVHVLIKSGASVNAASKDGFTAVHLSAISDNEKILKFLIENGGIANAQSKEKQTPLHTASENGCRNVLDILITKQIDINCKDSRGFTPLHLCCLNGHVHTTQLLLNRGANVNAYDKNKRTSLHLAALNDFCCIIDILIEQGAKIHCRDNKDFTALHLAALKGNVSVIQKLLSKNANINAADAKRVSALHLAVQGGHKQATEILIQKGSKIDCRVSVDCSLLNDESTKWEGKFHEEVFELVMKDVPKMKSLILKRYESRMMFERVYTPLYFAIYNNDTDIVALLVSSGAEVQFRGGICPTTAVYFGYEKVLSILLKSRKFDVSKDGLGLLYVASLKGHVRIVEMLLSKGVPVSEKSFVLSPLYAAAEKGYSDIVKLLIEKHANANLIDDYGTTPLHRAAAFGYKKVVEVLLQSKAVPAHLRDFVFTTPLEQAAANGHVEIAEMLLQYKKVNINAKGKDDFTVLHIAAQEGKLEMTKLLVNRGADLMASNYKGTKPIHVAAREGHVNVVDFFLSVGVDINVRGVSGQTCLHYAVATGQVLVVKLLLEKNIDVNALDSNRLSALHVASCFCYRDIVKTLLENGAYFNVVDVINQQTPLEMARNKDIYDLLEATRLLFDAVKHNNPSKAEMCIKDGGVVNAKNKDNVTPLIYAAWKGFLKVVEVLLKNGVNPNVIGKGDCSPLHYASKFSHLEVVNILLLNGAVYDTETSNHKTPLDFAVHPDVIYLLTLTDKLFKYAQSKDINCIVELKKIKDINIMKVIAKVHNKKNETIIMCAKQNSYPFMEEVTKILCNVSTPLNLANEFFAQKKYEEGMNVLFRRF